MSQTYNDQKTSQCGKSTLPESIPEVEKTSTHIECSTSSCIFRVKKNRIIAFTERSPFTERSERSAFEQDNTNEIKNLSSSEEDGYSTCDEKDFERR
jgi:hypothetical protein